MRATTALPIAVAGHAGLPADATAVMVSVNLIDPTGPGLFSIGATAGAASGGFVYNTGEDTHATVIVPIDPGLGDVVGGHRPEHRRHRLLPVSDRDVDLRLRTVGSAHVQTT